WPGRTVCEAHGAGHMSIWSSRATMQTTVLAATRVGRGGEQRPVAVAQRPWAGGRSAGDKRLLRGASLLSGALAISTYCFGFSSSTCIPHRLRRTRAYI